MEEDVRRCDEGKEASVPYIPLEHHQEGLHVPEGSLTIPQGHFHIRYFRNPFTPVMIIVLSSLLTIHTLWPLGWKSGLSNFS